MIRPRHYVYKSPVRARRFRRPYASRSPAWAKGALRVLLGLLLFVFNLGLWVWLSCRAWDILCVDPYFRIQKIHVQGAKIFSTDEIIQRSKLLQTRNIFKADIREARRILEAEPLFERVEVWRQLPRELLIKVAERQPLAQVIPFHQDQAWLVDATGVVLSQAIEPTNLYPVIHMKLSENGLHRGARILNEALVRALKALDIFSDSVLKKMFDLERVDLTDESDVVLKSTEGLTVHLGQAEFENRLLRLLTILEDLKKKNRDPFSIDLRFRYVPVVLKEIKRSQNV